VELTLDIVDARLHERTTDTSFAMAWRVLGASRTGLLKSAVRKKKKEGALQLGSLKQEMYCGGLHL
jgi:hypothetical protein